jgi:hypothetical protein
MENLSLSYELKLAGPSIPRVSRLLLFSDWSSMLIFYVLL